MDASAADAVEGARPVRVRHVPQRFGLALVVDNDGAGDGAERGLLRVGDACVTLEIVGPDGSPSVLSWDPAEVAWDPVASAP